MYISGDIILNMFNNLGEIVRDDHRGNDNTNFSINTNLKSQRRKKSKQISSELILFMKNEESNGISL